MTEIPEALREDWQKVADLTGLPVHVFRNIRWQLITVTNKAHGVGEWLETIEPCVAPVNVDAIGTHGLGAVAGRTSYGEPVS